MGMVCPPADRRQDDDPHPEYLAAIRDWEHADRVHHAAQIGVACGGTPPSTLATTAARLGWAETTARIERQRVGRRWLTGLRLALEDDALRYATLLELMNALRPALEPVAERLDDIELLAAKRLGVVS